MDTSGLRSASEFSRPPPAAGRPLVFRPYPLCTYLLYAVLKNE